MLGMALAGLLGCLWAPLGTLWAGLLGLGQGGQFSVALLLVVLRAPNPQRAAQLSGMAQGVGYTLAAFGPLAVGLLHDAMGRWGAVGGCSCSSPRRRPPTGGRGRTARCDAAASEAIRGGHLPGPPGGAGDPRTAGNSCRPACPRTARRPRHAPGAAPAQSARHQHREGRVRRQGMTCSMVCMRACARVPTISSCSRPSSWPATFQACRVTSSSSGRRRRLRRNTKPKVSSV